MTFIAACTSVLEVVGLVVVVVVVVIRVGPVLVYSRIISQNVCLHCRQCCCCGGVQYSTVVSNKTPPTCPFEFP